MKVSVVIPTRNAERWIRDQLDRLLAQTVRPEILVMDSGSTDTTARIAAEFGRQVRLLRIPPESFDHGATRDAGLRQSSGDYVLFLSQDALPANETYVETLLLPFSEERVAAVCGRQVARPDAPEYEKLTRRFNYPEAGRVWQEADISRYGIKAYFFSDACSAFRRSAYESVGGFDRPILTNEDMMMAAKLLHAGWSLAYQPGAVVRHSHADTLAREYRRSVRIGEVMEQYRDRLRGADPGGEGLRMVGFVSRELFTQGKGGQLPVFLVRAAVRFTGYHAGRLCAKRKKTTCA